MKLYLAFTCFLSMVASLAGVLGSWYLSRARGRGGIQGGRWVRLSAWWISRSLWTTRSPSRPRYWPRAALSSSLITTWEVQICPT